MQVKEIKFKKFSFTGYEIEMPHAPLLLVKARSGYCMCGYLDIATAEKLGDCACVVRDVKNFDELLAAPVAELTARARSLKITRGMTALRALLRMNA